MTLAVLMLTALQSARAEPVPEADWTVVSGQWSLEGGALRGDGDHPNDWAYLESRAKLPSNYTLRARLQAHDGVAELVLEKCAGAYIRVYIYTVEENVQIGNGVVADGVPDGGPTIDSFPYEPISKGSSHDLVVERLGKHLSVTIDGTPALRVKVRPTGCDAFGLLTGSEATFSNVTVAAPTAE